MSASESIASDAALSGYIEAADEVTARERLGDLLGGTAAPLVWRVLRRQLGGRGSGVSEADLEDLHAATLLRLQLQLAALRSGEREPMASFPNYVAVAAFNAASAFLMAREPERTRLRHRVRYVLRKDSRLALWSARGQEMVCGLAAWRERAAAEAPRRLDEMAREAAGAPAGGTRLPALLHGLLERAGAPCRFEEVVDALALALGVHDEPVERLTESRSEGEGERAPEFEAADEAPSALAALEARQTLARLWTEIRALPPLQRSALLLNLRDDTGGDMLDALLTSGVTSAAELASVLGLSDEAWAELRLRLPLEDLRIAERLGLTRQQVINLRKSARLRLARRLRGRQGSPPGPVGAGDSRDRRMGG